VHDKRSCTSERFAHRPRVGCQLHGPCFPQVGERERGIRRQRAIERGCGPGTARQQQIDAFDMGVACHGGSGSDGKSVTVGENGVLPLDA